MHENNYTVISKLVPQFIIKLCIIVNLHLVYGIYDALNDKDKNVDLN